tara:strand:+ start:13136 stop:13372 length:237 start_codon:yes stop_codon:yes gene_type:complete
MSWFIVAIVYLHGIKNPDIMILNSPFASKIACKEGYVNNELIRQDMETQYPSMKSMSVMCMDREAIIQLRASYNKVAI